MDSSSKSCEERNHEDVTVDLLPALYVQLGVFMYSNRPTYSSNPIFYKLAKRMKKVNMSLQLVGNGVSSYLRNEVQIY